MPFTVVHARDAEPDFEALAAFTEDRLSAGERAQALDHLASCAQCRAIVAGLVRGRAPVQSSKSWLRQVLPLAASLAIAAVGSSVYFLMWRGTVPRTPDVRVAPAVPTPTPAAPSSPAPPPSPSPPVMTPAPVGSSPVVRPDTTRAGGTKSVGGRTFRLVAGEWIDDSYREIDGLPVVDVVSREDLDARTALRPFLALGRRFIVVVDGTVYRIALP